MKRQTAQREAIRQAFRNTPHPMGPREVLEAAHERAPTLGMATVYRTLKKLCETGWLARVELPGRPPRYELAEKDHHHHFLCRNCDRVYEVEGCLGDVDSVAPEGCTVEAHDLLLYGECSACRGSQAAEQPEPAAAPARRSRAPSPAKD